MTLEARIGKAETEVAALEARLPKVKAELDALRKSLAIARGKIHPMGAISDQPSTDDDNDEERRYPGLGNKSIIDRIHDHFQQHAPTEFSPAEVMACIGIPSGHMEGVRAAFKRLTARQVLVHVSHAKYKFNAPERDHPTQSSRRNCP